MSQRLSFGVFASLVVGACLTVSCSKDINGIQPPSATRAKPNITDSFSVVEDTKFIRIRQDALDKVFLLQASLIEQEVAAMGSALKSRTVMFGKKANKLVMRETTDGHVVTTDLPSSVLLAEFPIIEQNKDFITFDFNAGMSQVFVTSDWTGQDIGGKGLQEFLFSGTGQ